jgi:hypothetical protein
MTKRKASSTITFENPSVIEGVIVSSGGSLGSDPALVLILRPWRQIGGSEQTKDLRVEVPMKSEAALNLAMRKWGEGSVSMTVKTTHRATKLYLERIVAQSPLHRVKLSPELKRASDEQLKSKSVSSPILGRLKLERDYFWYVASRTYMSTRYCVIVVSDNPDDDLAVAKDVRRAERIVPRIEQSIPKLRKAIARDLLDTYNDSWLEKRRPLSATEFAQRHKLGSVQIGTDRITLHFENGGLFTEHIVEVRLSTRLSVQEILVS